ncbi:MAG: hypothetical protein WC464_00090 [Bdellovibrionales bacterium]|jgi:hypothetical protein
MTQNENFIRKVKQLEQDCKLGKMEVEALIVPDIIDLSCHSAIRIKLINGEYVDIRMRTRMWEDTQPHNCEYGGYGDAVTYCTELANGFLEVGNDTGNGNFVNFCPFCGYEAKVKIEL